MSPDCVRPTARVIIHRATLGRRPKFLFGCVGAACAVNGAIDPECMKCKCKGHIVRNVHECAVNLPLHDDAPDVPASRNRAGIECRSLPGLPCENQGGALDLFFGAAKPSRVRFSPTAHRVKQTRLAFIG